MRWRSRLAVVPAAILLAASLLTACGGTTAPKPAPFLTFALINGPAPPDESELVDAFQAATTRYNVTPLTFASSDFGKNAQAKIGAAADAGATTIIMADPRLKQAVAAVASLSGDPRYQALHIVVNDASVQAPPLSGENNAGYPWLEGVTYATNEAGCLLGVLAARRAEAAGSKGIGVLGEAGSRAADNSWIAGYSYCARKAVPGIRIRVSYTSAPPSKAAICIGQQLEVVGFVMVIEGACGDESSSAPAGPGNSATLDGPNDTVLAIGAKDLSLGVTTAVKEAAEGTWAGGSDLDLDLANGGVAVTGIDPATPASVIAELAAFKRRIKTNRLIVPTVP